MELKAPFPYFGGKRDAAALVWSALGDVENYIEPFFGSGAVLLGRPGGPGMVETVNDVDGLLANVWRALRADPDGVAKFADWPINEIDLMARHLWLCGQREEITSRLVADPEFFDAKAAGWWIWGASQWIGSGWCSGRGGWSLQDGRLQQLEQSEEPVRKTISRKRPKLGHQGSGVHAPRLRHKKGPTVDGEAGHQSILKWFRQLMDRLRNVRVLCGDWSRVLGPSSTYKNLAVRDGFVGVFLDPPYSDDVRVKNLYAKDAGSVASDVRAWCAENGSNPKMKIVLSGYAGEGHEQLVQKYGWTEKSWGRSGFFQKGYSSQHNERVWCSPNCVHRDNQLDLW